MSLLSAMDIASSSLSAESYRLNLTASNLANANSVSSSINRTYRGRHPVFTTISANPDATAFGDVMDGLGRGVRLAAVVESAAPLRKEYHPENPLANKEGYVFLPNVNTIEEMANMISASRSYSSNIEVFNSAKQMLLRTLTLGQ
ncbi:MAG TPA: flagellar basal body rod protein FlgC [Gammaproteobacteria bacterium]|mgnify:CR=1 FL=1|nr:flagellar basal body rod protein FlgC [Gammaproteobacteria bacterium]